MQDLIKLAIAESKDPVVIITNHFSKGKEPKIVYANQQFLNLVGCSIDEIFNLHPKNLFSAKNSENIMDEIKQTVIEHKTWEGPIVVNHKDGEHQVLYFNIVPVHNLTKEILYYACFGREIKVQEEQVCDKVTCQHLDNFVNSLFTQNKYLNDINENLPTGIWRIDSSFEVVYSNPVSQGQFGLINESNFFDNILHTEHRFVKTMLNNSGTEQKINRMTFRIKKDDTIIWVGCDFWPVLEDDNIVGYAGTFKNVTNEQMLVKQLQVFKTNATVVK